MGCGGSSLSTSTRLTHAAHEFELLLNARTGTDWVLNPDLGVTVPLDRSTLRSAWGLPVAPPEVIVFFKGGGDLTAAQIEAWSGTFRPRDERDFHALLPTLTGTARSWLRQSLAAVLPEHPWLPHLT
jgi:hypothetical protein